MSSFSVPLQAVSDSTSHQELSVWTTPPVLTLPNAWARNGQTATLPLLSPTLSRSPAFLRAFMSASQRRFTETIETVYRACTAFTRWQSYASVLRDHGNPNFSADPWCGASQRTQRRCTYCCYWKVDPASGKVIQAALVWTSKRLNKQPGQPTQRERNTD